MEKIAHRIIVVNDALVRTENPESQEIVVSFAKCVYGCCCRFPFSLPTRSLVSVAVDANEMRSSPGWKKALFNDEQKDQVDKIVARIDEQTQNFSVRESYSIIYGGQGQQIFRFPSRCPSNVTRRPLSSVSL
jgi:hypothetical protein